MKTGHEANKYKASTKLIMFKRTRQSVQKDTFNSNQHLDVYSQNFVSSDSLLGFVRLVRGLGLAHFNRAGGGGADPHN